MFVLPKERHMLTRSTQNMASRYRIIWSPKRLVYQYLRCLAFCGRSFKLVIIRMVVNISLLLPTLYPHCVQLSLMNYCVNSQFSYMRIMIIKPRHGVIHALLHDLFRQKWSVYEPRMSNITVAVTSSTCNRSEACV
jgi:hypothetical protein